MKLRIGWECLIAGFSQVHCAKVSNSPSEMEPQQPSHCMHGWVCVGGSGTSAPWLVVCKLKP